MAGPFGFFMKIVVFLRKMLTEVRGQQHGGGREAGQEEETALSSAMGMSRTENGQNTGTAAKFRGTLKTSPPCLLCSGAGSPFTTSVFPVFCTKYHRIAALSRQKAHAPGCHLLPRLSPLVFSAAGKTKHFSLGRIGCVSWFLSGFP